MAGATKWEYAVFYGGGTNYGDDPYIHCYWGQGEDFVARATKWFGDKLQQDNSHTQYLRFKKDVSTATVLGFLGNDGWEMVGVSNNAYLMKCFFKRPI